jgi:hypothetical protein
LQECGPVTVVFDPGPGYDFPIGVTEVRVEVTDASGNSASCSYRVEVIEYIPSVVSMVCNSSINLSLGSDCRAEINGDMLLEGGNYRCYDNYCITLRDAWNQVIGTSVGRHGGFGLGACGYDGSG